LNQETFNRASDRAKANFNRAFMAEQTPGMMSRFGGVAGRTALGIAGGLGVATGVAAVGMVMRDTMRVSMAFEKSMSRVAALLQFGTGATDGQVASLGRLARQLGAETVFTARDAAEAMQFFALAGFKVNQITEAMRPTMDLAAAGQISIAESANIAAIVMSG